uniref:Uncharacterized protein n=1 Tax=Arundo donax TaxID=35708 RepID=A0A0A9EHU4_ARUDO
MAEHLYHYDHSDHTAQDLERNS